MGIEMSKTRINHKTRINRRTIRNRNNLSKNNGLQKGGKTVLPMRYFTENFNKHYYENPTSHSDQSAHAHGVIINGGQYSAPDLKISSPKQQGGGALPSEYFGGNSSRYFEAGAPELLNCDSAYGRIISNSHGVVMDSPNGNWMAPNLAVFPNSPPTQTGGGKKKSRKQKKSRKLKK